MKTTLLVIDFITGIAANTGSCAQYLTDHPEVISNTNAIINQARQNNIDIMHIRLAFDNDYTGLPKHAPTAQYIKDHQLFAINSEACAFIPEIDRHPDDTIINKTYGDVFHGNNLINILKTQGTEKLIFTGIATDNAILNSANTAIVNDFYVSIIKDACGAPSQEAHDHAIAIMTGRSASEITTTQEWLNHQ